MGLSSPRPWLLEDLGLQDFPPFPCVGELNTVVATLLAAYCLGFCISEFCGLECTREIESHQASNFVGNRTRMVTESRSVRRQRSMCNFVITASRTVSDLFCRAWRIVKNARDFPTKHAARKYMIGAVTFFLEWKKLSPLGGE